jgi:hypothetical protein
MKLTDTQLVLLSAASQRRDGAVEIGPEVKGGAADKMIAKLLRQQMVEEIPAQGALPVWRREDAVGALALRITKRGLAAIGADHDGQAGIAGVRAPDPAPRRAAAARKPSGAARRSPAKVGRGGSKQAAVIAMLESPKGTTIPAARQPRPRRFV